MMEWSVGWTDRKHPVVVRALGSQISFEQRGSDCRSSPWPTKLKMIIFAQLEAMVLGTVQYVLGRAQQGGETDMIPNRKIPQTATFCLVGSCSFNTALKAINACLTIIGPATAYPRESAQQGLERQLRRRSKLAPDTSAQRPHSEDWCRVQGRFSRPRVLECTRACLKRKKPLSNRPPAL